jgi:hypothetical protein
MRAGSGEQRDHSVVSIQDDALCSGSLPGVLQVSLTTLAMKSTEVQ